MADPRKPRRRRRLRLLLIAFCVVALAATGTAYYLGRQIVAPIDRIEGVFGDVPGHQRPAKPTSGPGAEAVNILLLGTDRRSEIATTGDRAGAAAWVPGAQRSDAMLLLHIDADRKGATVISLPRDSWVEVPGHGYDKINAAYSYGGAALAVATVERLTQVRVDHLAVIDWEGIRRLTDELGGVTITVPETVYDSARGVTWTAGVHELDGQAAVDYLGQRYGLPAGDLDRARRHQNFLRVLMVDTLRRISEAGPWEIYELLKVMTNNLSVNDEWSTKDMARLAWSLRDLGGSDLAFLTVPVAGLGWEGPQSVVHLDLPMGRRLWSAVRADRVSAWLADHPEAHLEQTVR
ncbi:MAG: LCP family protein [Actinomycetota bacterium]|nr:LCP family protein [Actinomycetota bacterium]